MATLRIYQSSFCPTSPVSKSRYGTGIRFSLLSPDSMSNGGRPRLWAADTIY